MQNEFKLVDAKVFEKLSYYFSDYFMMYFAHYTLKGMKQAMGFVGAFDRKLPKYQHVIRDVYTGEDLIVFDGALKICLDEDIVISTPFWDKIELVPDTEKLQKMYALFSFAAVPESFWGDMKAEDYGSYPVQNLSRIISLFQGPICCN